jgi:hypothetical protein
MPTYTPSKSKQPQAPADTRALPPALGAALADAERVLAERDKLHSALVRTHEQIPELLRRRADAQSKLAAAEVSGTDAASIRDERLRIESERLSAVERRAGAIEGLLMQEPELAAARDTLNTARKAYAAGAVEEFQHKYAAAVLALQTTWAEGAELARAMRCDVPMPLPIKVTGGPQQGLHPWPAEPLPVKTERIMGDARAAPVKIDATAARIGGVLDRLDRAIVFASGLRETQSRQRTSRPYGDRPVDFAATYRTIQPIRCLFDGLEFAPGTLVDVSLLGPIALSRHLVTKGIRVENGGGGRRAEAA